MDTNLLGPTAWFLLNQARPHHSVLRFGKALMGAPAMALAELRDHESTQETLDLAHRWSAESIEALAPLLRDIPSARLYEESLKMLEAGYGLETYHLMREYNLFQQIFPTIAEHFTSDYSSKTEQMLDLAFDSTDQRLEEGKRVNPAFMFAAIYWYPLVALAEKLMEQRNLCYYDAIMEASNLLLDEVVKSIAIPRRHTTTIREIWQLQLRLPRRTGKRAFRLLELNKFRAGFDFLLMRREIEDDETKELADWWQTFEATGRNQRQIMVAELGAPKTTRNKPRRRNPSPKKTNPEE